MITIVSGTNRPDSYTLKVAKYYQHVMAKIGVDANLLSLTSLPGNIIESDLYGKRSAAFEPILEMVNQTERFVFIIPEYNGSFPGVLKTFIDACKFPESFYNKKCCLVGISAGKYGNIRGVDHFGGVCSYLHLNVLPLRLHIPVITNEVNDSGDLLKEDTIRFTAEQINKFLEY